MDQSSTGQESRRVVRLLVAWVLFHLLFWTLLPLLCNTCLPLDCIEAVMWGSEWEWGYDKHPPLSAWAAQLFAILMGDAGVYLLSQLCVVTAGLGVYRLARFMGLGLSQAAYAVLLLECIYFYNYSSVEFNVNILQLPFWAWGWFLGLHALEKKNGWSWLGLGLCVGLGALTKYIAVFMLIPLFAAWGMRGQWRRALQAPGLWFAGIVSGVVFLPHLLWMQANDWITITYGLRRTGGEGAVWWQHFVFALEYLLSNAAILMPLIVIAMLCRRGGNKAQVPAGAIGFALGGYTFMILLTLLMGMEPVTMWAVPLPLAIGIWLVPRYNLDRFPLRVLPVVLFMGLLGMIAYGVTYGLGPQIRDKPHRVNYPASKIAAQVEAAWANTQKSPLPYIIADEWLGGIVNHYGEADASVMIRGVPARSNYLSEADIRREGGVVLWLKSRDTSDPTVRSLKTAYPDLKERYPNAVEVEDLVIAWPRRSDGKSGRYGLAIIPPKM